MNAHANGRAFMHCATCSATHALAQCCVVAPDVGGRSAIYGKPRPSQPFEHHGKSYGTPLESGIFRLFQIRHLGSKNRVRF